LLAIAPKPGTNTILITHKPNILDALGKDWFDVKHAPHRARPAWAKAEISNRPAALNVGRYRKTLNALLIASS
jgi:hypothetical protein